MHHVRRICIALLIGVLSAAACYAHKSPVGHAADFMWPYRAAQVLRDGDNPYRVALPDLPYDPDAPLYYPLPAVLVALPFSYLPPVVARSTFIGVSAALLAWALQREGRWRLWMFVGAPWWAIAANQWSLLTAALLIPVLQGLVALKPNLGMGIIVYQPRWRPLLIGAAMLVTVSLVVLPTWPLDWLANLQRNRHHTPLVLLPFGPLLLLTATRWKSARARLVLALACFPQQVLGYDQVALGLVARSAYQQLVLALLSWLPVVGALLMGEQQGLTLVLVYGPAAVIAVWPTLLQHGLRWRPVALSRPAP